nr:immunoglobulin heavy chain junction region [Macaca mulatta]MOV37894.1 immunoglobulin heavy chain junction region [Macaca mulatta]MOV38003.1 immunoglobulin heavy chain junction region [Macaca mulatta]MOV38039.1 immunoglobulin heavy chain junction region [Macaca mulatta]MOV38043.1 immunoglobulin heavy chain junction region [Macaca mulatta]
CARDGGGFGLVLDYW